MRFTYWLNHKGTIHIRDEDDEKYLCGIGHYPNSNRTNIRLSVCVSCKGALARLKRKERQWWSS